jgi:DNA-binding transcriptional ArsR family regulator
MAATGAPPISDAFGVLAHPLRREIIVELAEGEKAVRDLAERLPVSRPAVSQHLRLMLDLGIVTQESVGRESIYRLNPDGLDEVRQWMTSLDAMWAGAMMRLARHLERKR